MTAQEYAAAGFAAHGGDSSAQTLLIALRAASRRGTLGPKLPERQIASQHHPSGGAERFRQRNQQRRICVGTRAVSQDQAVGYPYCGAVKIPAHRHLIYVIFAKRNAAIHFRLHYNLGI